MKLSVYMYFFLSSSFFMLLLLYLLKQRRYSIIYEALLLTIANTKIHYFYRNNAFNVDLTCARVRKPLPLRAVPLALVAVLLSFFNSRLLEHLSCVHFK